MKKFLSVYEATPGTQTSFIEKKEYGLLGLMKNRAGHHFRKGKNLNVVIEDHGIFKVSMGTYKDKEYQVEACNLTCSV